MTRFKATSLDFPSQDEGFSDDPRQRPIGQEIVYHFLTFAPLGRNVIMNSRHRLCHNSAGQRESFGV